MAASLSEEEESLLISKSSFACIKNKNTALKRLAVVTLLTFGVSNLLHVHFHPKFWFILVRQLSQRLRQM